MHRPLLACLLVVPLAAAGCLGGGAEPQDDAPPARNETAATPTVPGAPVDAGVVAPVTRSAPMRMVYHYAPDYTLATAPPADGKVAERLEPGGFARYAAVGAPFPDWPAPVMGHGMEIVGDMTITLVFSADTPAPSSTEPVFGSAGGWFGSADRWDYFSVATDAPKAVEPGKTYTVTLTHPSPKGGWFLRPGEPFAAHSFIGYHTAPGGLHYHVGAAGSSIAFDAVRVNLSATRAVETLNQNGELQANPDASSANGIATEVPFALPPGTLYAVVDMTASPSPPAQRIDADLQVSAGSEMVGSSHGPTHHEVVVIGPGQIAANGLDYVARASTSASGAGTFTLVVTAYVAA